MTIQDWFEKRKEAQIQRRALEARAEVEKILTFGQNVFIATHSF